MFDIAKETKKKIVENLKELSVCDLCIVRYLGYKRRDDGKDVFLSPETVVNNIICEKDESETEIKKIKPNPCRACLNVLNDATIERYMSRFPEDFKKYEFKQFKINIILPVATYLREFNMFIYLKEIFPEVYKNIEDIETIKTIFKLSVNTSLSLKMSKALDYNSNFEVNVQICYPDDDKETTNVKNLFSNGKSSKTFVIEFLKDCSEELFKRNFQVPPPIPNEPTLAEFYFSSLPIFIGGRYLKFSREMGQTPFKVDNKPVTEFCVQEKIFEGVMAVLGTKEEDLTFSASGREDVDTRMVGNGRPFYIQISNPTFEHVTAEQCRSIENIIINSQMIAVKNLKQISKNSLALIKNGEEKKTKNYRALCKTLASNVEEVVNLLNSYPSKICLEQATPIRVLHRRTQSIRKRNIYNIKAGTVSGSTNLFYLDLTTDAGTYVKEFVNGDFNRTIPNVSAIIGHAADVVALDVLDVDLDWP